MVYNKEATEFGGFFMYRMLYGCTVIRFCG